jgi:hypothetical protein
MDHAHGIGDQLVEEVDPHLPEERLGGLVGHLVLEPEGVAGRRPALLAPLARHLRGRHRAIGGMMQEDEAGAGLRTLRAHDAPVDDPTERLRVDALPDGHRLGVVSKGVQEKEKVAAVAHPYHGHGPTGILLKGHGEAGGIAQGRRARPDFLGGRFPAQDETLVVRRLPLPFRGRQPELGEGLPQAFESILGRGRGEESPPPIGPGWLQEKEGRPWLAGPPKAAIVLVKRHTASSCSTLAS